MKRHILCENCMVVGIMVPAVVTDPLPMCTECYQAYLDFIENRKDHNAEQFIEEAD